MKECVSVMSERVRETDTQREKENEGVRKTEKGKCEIDGR